MRGKRFTVKSIEALKPREVPFEIREAGRQGLLIRVTPTGVKTWYSAYRFNGKLQRVYLGTWPTTGIEAAHKAHEKVREALRQGRNPAEEKAAKKRAILEAPTVRKVFESFFAREGSKLRPRTLTEYKRQADVDILPSLGKLKAESVTRRHIAAFIDIVAARSPIMANREFATIRRVFNWAVAESIIEDNPARFLKAPAREHRRDRVLNTTEVKTFWEALDSANMSDEMRRALKLVLLTALRPGEVAALHYDDIDGPWLTIPAERSKNNIPHRVFLTPFALRVLKPEGTGYVFTKVEGKPFSFSAPGRAVARNRAFFQEAGIAPFTAHDLRRTAATLISARGASREVVKSILNHVDSDVTSIYDRASFDEGKKRALLKLSRTIENLVTGKIKTVVSLRP